jgi:hypothetical protein
MPAQRITLGVNPMPDPMPATPPAVSQRAVSADQSEQLVQTQKGHLPAVVQCCCQPAMLGTAGPYCRRAADSGRQAR